MEEPDRGGEFFVPGRHDPGRGVAGVPAANRWLRKPVMIEVIDWSERLFAEHLRQIVEHHRPTFCGGAVAPGHGVVAPDKRHQRHVTIIDGAGIQRVIDDESVRVERRNNSTTPKRLLINRKTLDNCTHF